MVDADAFRGVMGEFATGVTVVTLPGENGTPHGITVNAFASLSLDPPLVLVSLDHGTEAHRILADGDADSYAVNILAHDQRGLAEHFAGMTDGDADPFETEHTTTEATGAPVFTDSLAYVDCTIHDTIEEGDHTLYVGRAERADTPNPDADPLTFHRGDWGTITTDD
ncbi:flavin reductase family protein [Halocalculus aciditolerans]|uniref:Flavin oxidoreductase n=1 Tax=Halocalculus aciditolerans TaxID=1383812 RepID=A0A830F8C1_9EURY|nr:flavin reductase family protein [Halocalculus aciditolerans]GGL73257.1 flavin oxidoreductase [Halocalculus aciditolerans]